LKNPNAIVFELDEMDSKEYVSIDELAKYLGISRQTIAKRLDVFTRTKPGPGGARLYPTQVALYIASDGDERPYRLTSRDALRVQLDLVIHRMRELESIVAPITSAARIKKEIRCFARETFKEQHELGVAINRKFKS
jgi:transcriptional antiterminator